MALSLTFRKETRFLLPAALALLGLALAPVRGDDEKPSYFPLDLKRHWRYRLTLHVEGANKQAIRDRTVASPVRKGERDAVVFEDKVDNALAHSETFAQDGDRILLLSFKDEGGAERVEDPPRTYLVLSKLDTVGAVWSWTSTDGRESYMSTVTKRGLDKDGRDEVTVEVKGKLTSTKGVGTQEHTLTLVRGVGVTKERNETRPPGGHATTTESDLSATDTGAPPPK